MGSYRDNDHHGDALHFSNLNIKFSRSVVGMAEGRVHLNPERPVSCWEETVAGDQLKFCVSPVLVCTKVKQTAGGGDNITGAGLYAQI